jgi:hypothetical protein
MVGHVVMGWTGDGRYNLAYHNPDNCVIGRTLLPSWIGEAVRRSLIVDGHWH